MKKIIDLIKSSPLVTASAIVSILGIVVIGYFYFIAAPNYSVAKSEVLKEQKQRQDRLMTVSVPIPNKDPNAPADMVRAVINPTVIMEVGGIYTTIRTHYGDILLSAQEKNSRHHAGVLLGGNAIWPDANPTQFFDLYVRAAADYTDHFKALFDVQSSNNWNMPVFSAASPPTREELDAILARSAFEYISSVGAQSAADLSQSQAEQLFAEQRMTLMNALNGRARRINLYVALPPEEDRFAPKEDSPSAADATPAAPGGFAVAGQQPGAAGTASSASADYPFLIAPWAFADQPPTPDQLWEGQTQIWIMRDIMIAIRRMNNVGGKVKAIGPDGAIRDEEASVVNSPIKRLLELKTLPGYVGLHNTGSAMGGVDERTSFSVAAMPGGAASAQPQPGVATPSIYPTPPVELAPKAVTDRAAEHFGITPTGRISNSIFDVRHTQLVIDIEADKLPAFFEMLRKENFMTVLKAEITDVDEYALLQEGYVYGHSDVVRAKLVVESLWFRNWTEDLMPTLVKEKLLIILPEDLEEQQSEPF